MSLAGENLSLHPFDLGLCVRQRERKIIMKNSTDLRRVRDGFSLRAEFCAMRRS